MRALRRTVHRRLPPVPRMSRAFCVAGLYICNCRHPVSRLYGSKCRSRPVRAYGAPPYEAVLYNLNVPHTFVSAHADPRSFYPIIDGIRSHYGALFSAGVGQRFKYPIKMRRAITSSEPSSVPTQPDAQRRGDPDALSTIKQSPVPARSSRSSRRSAALTSTPSRRRYEVRTRRARAWRRGELRGAFPVADSKGARMPLGWYPRSPDAFEADVKPRVGVALL